MFDEELRNFRKDSIPFVINMKIALVVIFLVALLLKFLIFFYRMPAPILRKDSFDTVYSPAYGTVLETIETPQHVFIAIFLSPFDVHYQYAPVSGVVKNVTYDPTGQFALAYDLNKSRENEKAITSITTPNGTFIVQQIAGTLVRRISTFVNEGEKIESGQLLGLIHFGSRVDIFIPKSLRSFRTAVRKGDRVSGSATVLGHYA
jgi:phosphatidylserine decarboxylase